MDARRPAILPSYPGHKKGLWSTVTVVRQGARGDPYSRTQITQITAGFSPIDPAMITIQPLGGSELFFLKKTAEASRARLNRFAWRSIGENPQFSV
jgi:hypothetical protein